MILGNFPTDTLADDALRAARRFLASLPCGPRLVPPPSPFVASSAEGPQTAAAAEHFPPVACSIYSWYFLSSAISNAFASPSFGRMVIQEARE